MKVQIECDEKEAILMLTAMDLLPRLHTIKERIRRCLKDDTTDLIYECLADIEELLVNLE
jgi:hypothetical protein